MKINKHVFRGYDIRGVYPVDIDGNFANILGQSFGSYIRKFNKDTVIVGMDNRFSSKELHDRLIKGLLLTGTNVIDLGLVTTPMYYYACIKLNNPTGIMITASHNPKDDNGFKFAFDERGNARGEMIEEFRDFTLEGNFLAGTGKYSTYDIKEEYKELFKNSLSFGDRKLKVIIDLGNATPTIIARKIYEMFPMDLEVLFEESDPSFPNHHPDPCVAENLSYLRKRVLETNADIGIGFDGDGDRVGIIDELGNYIPTDQYMIIIIRDIIDKVVKKKFLYDVKCSKALSDEIEKLGGEGVCYRTGNSYTKTKTAELDLPFGGEFSGHVYFRDRFPGIDSGLYAGLRLVEIMSKNNLKVSQMLNGINKYYSTEEIKIPSPDDIKFNVVDKVLEYVNEKGYEALTIDGVRVNFSDSWVLVRASNTGPNLTFRAEATTHGRLEEVQKEFLSVIEKCNKK